MFSDVSQPGARDNPTSACTSRSLKSISPQGTQRITGGTLNSAVPRCTTLSRAVTAPLEATREANCADVERLVEPPSPPTATRVDHISLTPRWRVADAFGKPPRLIGGSASCDAYHGPGFALEESATENAALICRVWKCRRLLIPLVLRMKVTVPKPVVAGPSLVEWCHGEGIAQRW